MKKLYVILVVSLIIGNVSSYAKKVEVSNAQIVALNCYYEKVNNSAILAFKDIAITETFTVSDAQANPVYYVFNFNERGFVIISADDIAMPIIAYSLEDAYSNIEQPENFKEWMQQYAEIIISARENKAVANNEINAEWKHYLATPFVLVNSTKDVNAVGPLCTSKWDQIFPYNTLCPAASGGPGSGHALTGCIATSMAQIMYYWKYPITGIGTHTSTYNSSWTVNPGTTTYQYSQMVDKPTSANNAIATLMYHAGVTANLQYAANGTYGDTQYAITGLVEHFGFHSSMQKLWRDQYTGDWVTLIKSNLDKKRPVIYGGACSSLGSHSFICDGYDASNKFHFNFGFSGACNGFYDINNLAVGGIIGTVTGHKALVNIFPKNVGVEDVELSATLNIYPNPAENLLNVSFNSASTQSVDIALLSLTGQLIFSDVIKSSSKYSKTIDISTVAKGIYILRVITDEGVINRKVVVE